MKWKYRLGWMVVAVAFILAPGFVEAQEYTISISPSTISEATTTTGAVKVTVTRTTMAGGGVEAVSVLRLESSDAEATGTALAGTLDYTLTPPSVFVFPAVTTATTDSLVWTVSALQDGVVEGPEDLDLGVYTLSGAVAPTALSGTLQDQESLTIEDDDSPAPNSLRLTGGGKTIKESDTATARKIKLTVSQPERKTFTDDQTIDLVFGGDATKGTDYTVKDEVLVLSAGDIKVETDLTILDDMVYDGPVSETIRVSAFIGNVQLGGSAGTQMITIDDNDQNPEDFDVSVDPAMIMEGEVATVTVASKTNLAAAQEFMLMLAGTAMQNSDYTIPATLTIAKGTKTGSVQLQAVMDGAAEMDESVMVTVMSGGVMIGTVQTVTITDVTSTPALPIFGAFALGAGLFAAGRARLRRRQALRAGQTRGGNSPAS